MKFGAFGEVAKIETCGSNDLAQYITSYCTLDDLWDDLLLTVQIACPKYYLNC